MSTLKFSLSATLASALLCSAALADEVNIYSYRQPELLKPLTDAFTAKTGIDVNVAFMEKGMIERLKAEGRRSPADVILTVDISRLSGVISAGLAQSVESETINANVPAQYRDPDNQWFGLSTRARIAYVSKSRVSEDEFTTYEDLADPKFQGRICTRSGMHDYNIGLTSAMIHHHGVEGAKTWLEGLKSNLARKPQGNDRAQVKAIWAGECDIAIGNTYYMGAMLADPEQTEWADSVKIVFPTFENAGTHVNISGVAMAKHAPHPEQALALMEFLTTPEAQEIYAEANFEYPIKEGTSPAELVASWGSFVADDVNLMDLAPLRSDALRLTEEVNFDG